MRAIIGLTSIGHGFEFVSERGGPFLPSEIALLGKFNGEREGLRLPGFGKDWPALITGKLRQLGGAFGFAHGIRLVQDSHPTYPRKRNCSARLARPTVRARRSAPSKRVAAFPLENGRRARRRQRR